MKKGSFTYAEVNDDILNEAEKVLKCKLPAEYISLLKTFGQGGIGGLEVLGVGKDGSLVFVNHTLKYRSYGLPDELIMIENCDEWLYCINAINGEIVKWVNKNVSYIKAYDNYKYSGEIKVADANNGKGLTAINRMAERAHAEVGTMNQSFSDVNKPRGGEGFLIVNGENICRFCQVDVKKMANALGLERLTVIENKSGNVYVFDVNTATQNGNKNPFLNVRQGGLRWKEARVQPN